jgi:hypothetical protein
MEVYCGNKVVLVGNDCKMMGIQGRMQITYGIGSIFGGTAFFVGTSYSAIAGATKSTKKERITSTDFMARFGSKKQESIMSMSLLFDPNGWNNCKTTQRKKRYDPFDHQPWPRLLQQVPYISTMIRPQ